MDSDLHIEFSPRDYADREAALRAFRGPLKLFALQRNNGFVNPTQLVYLLSELAKNTYDHSTGIGILDIHLPSNAHSLLVTYLDTGEPFDCEHWAQPGLSTKIGNGTNLGLGLWHVCNGAAGVGCRLAISRIETGTEFRFCGQRQQG